MLLEILRVEALYSLFCFFLRSFLLKIGVPWRLISSSRKPVMIEASLLKKIILRKDHKDIFYFFKWFDIYRIFLEKDKKMQQIISDTYDLDSLNWINLLVWKIFLHFDTWELRYCTWIVFSNNTFFLFKFGASNIRRIWRDWWRSKIVLFDGVNVDTRSRFGWWFYCRCLWRFLEVKLSILTSLGVDILFYNSFRLFFWAFGNNYHLQK